MEPGVSRPVLAGGACRAPRPQDVALPTPLPNRQRVLVPGQPVAAFLREPYPIAILMPSVTVGRQGAAPQRTGTARAAVYVGAAREDAHPTVSGSTPAHAHLCGSPRSPQPRPACCFSVSDSRVMSQSH